MNIGLKKVNFRSFQVNFGSNMVILGSKRVNSGTFQIFFAIFQQFSTFFNTSRNFHKPPCTTTKKLLPPRTPTLRPSPQLPSPPQKRLLRLESKRKTRIRNKSLVLCLSRRFCHNFVGRKSGFGGNKLPPQQSKPE